MYGVSSLRTLLAVSIVMLTVGCAGSMGGTLARDESPWPVGSIRDTLTGNWGWNADECAVDPLRISFSDDGATMYHRNNQGLVLGDVDNPRLEIVYEIQDETDTVLRSVAVDEDRRTADGATVGWDLVLQDRDHFCWRRSDWPEVACTASLMRCPR